MFNHLSISPQVKLSYNSVYTSSSLSQQILNTEQCWIENNKIFSLEVNIFRIFNFLAQLGTLIVCAEKTPGERGNVFLGRKYS